MNPESVAKITEACAAIDGHQCAIQRLGRFDPVLVPPGADLSWTFNTSDVAMAAGFTKAEAYGIMDGWDDCTIGDNYGFSKHIHTDEELVEYSNGMKLGNDLAKRFADRGRR